MGLDMAKRKLICLGDIIILSQSAARYARNAAALCAQILKFVLIPSSRQALRRRSHRRHIGSTILPQVSREFLNALRSDIPF